MNTQFDSITKVDTGKRNQDGEIVFRILFRGPSNSAAIYLPESLAALVESTTSGSFTAR